MATSDHRGLEPCQHVEPRLFRCWATKFPEGYTALFLGFDLPLVDTDLSSPNPSTASQSGRAQHACPHVDLNTGRLNQTRFRFQARLMSVWIPRVAKPETLPGQLHYLGLTPLPAPFDPCLTSSAWEPHSSIVFSCSFPDHRRAGQGRREECDIRYGSISQMA